MPLTVPYCTSAEFSETPTSLETLDLRSGDPLLRDQTAALNKILLIASDKCDSYVDFGSDGTLTAHVKTERRRMRPDKYGRLLFWPAHTPFVSLISLSYGRTPSQLTTIVSPTVFSEDDRSVIVDLQAGTGRWSGSLQLGGLPPSAELMTTWTYIAGYPNTLTTALASSGTSVFSVADAIGIQPGQGLRIFDPGQDEAIIIGSSWVPTIGPATLPLASPLLNTHTLTEPVRVSAMDHDIFEATVCFAIAMLLRPSSSAEDPFPDLRGGASTRTGDSRKDGSGFIASAEDALENYRRVI